MILGWLYEPPEPGGKRPRPADPGGAGSHRAERTTSPAYPNALAITHGAGSNCEAPLIVAVAEAFAEAGWWVLRFDLPYRQERPRGSPHPSKAARDREGIERTAGALRELTKGRIFLSGSSYGGRQSTMLVSENPGIADGLLLLSYPLHPPGKPEALRTAHFPKIETPAMFVHGTRDAFGSIEEMRTAIATIPARHELVTVEGAPHGLPPKVSAWLPGRFAEFIGS